ncbi:MAG TPA: adenosylcobinamide-GDP ribazoletransferase [Methylophilaceae bacterium]|nr:adenosylcobinamide-GDP ribazoletransferase [Methylophilaceae bacterium]
MKTLIAEWRLIKVALSFFTRLPVHIPDFRESDLNHAVPYFPLVGIVVGLLAAAIFGIAILVLPLELAVLASMAATLWLTGAFHEDGLADAADGLGGGSEKGQVLTIMQDSRLGSFGAIALFMVLLVKFETLTHLSAPLLPAILVAGHALSRFAALLVIYTQSYVRAEGKAKPLATRLTTRELWLGTAFGLLPLLLLAPKLWLALLPVALVWWWFSRKLQQRLGGYTGDCLGAMQQLTEIAFYLGILVWSSI